MSGSNNFLPFNPTDTTNTDDDATYAARSQRTGGLDSGLAIKAMHNKLFRQATVMAAALGQFMANQGQTVSDADVAALTTVISNSLASKSYADSILATANGAIPKSLITAAGDMFYGSAPGVAARLGKSIDGYILKLVSGFPAWVQPMAQGNYTDTSTYITANGTFTVTIPIGFNAQRGRLIISKVDGTLGAIIFFGTNATDAFSIWNSNSFAFAGGQLTSYSGSSFSNCGGNNFVNVQNVVITGSNLIITFIVSSFSTGSYKYYYTLRWEAEG